MNLKKLSQSSLIRYSLFGFIFGLLFPIGGFILEIVYMGLPFTAESLRNIQFGHALMWLVETAPLFLAFAFGFGGRRQDELQKLSADLDIRLQEGTSDLLAANKNLENDMHVLKQLEVVIESGKKEWEAIFDSISDMIFVVNAEGLVVRCNRAVIDRFKTNFPSITGKPLAEIIYPDLAGVELKLGAIEIPNVYGYFDLSAKSFNLEPGKPRTIYVFHDMTERKQAQEALADERNLLRTLIDNLPDRVYVKDKLGRKTLSNMADALASGGRTAQDVIGKSDFDLYPAELAAQYWENDRTVIEGGALISNKEEPGLDESGKEVWILTTKAPLRDTKGNILGLVGIGRDITEIKRAEEELLYEKEFLEALNQNSPVAIVVLDKEDNIVSCNPAFEHLYGYDSNEIKGRNLDALITTKETIAEALVFSSEARANSIHKIGYRRRMDGGLVTVEIFGVPVVVAGKKVGTLAIYHDITELDQARKEAEQANHAKSEFLANMSHEIRTPMNGVIGMLELALDTQLTEEQRDYLSVSLQSAETLLALINDILDFSKIEAQKLELEMIDFDLRNLVEDVAQMMAMRAQTKGLELVCLVHPEVKTELKGDPARLRQILVNLIGNAIKFTQQGEIVVRAEPVVENETELKVTFSVEDTGIGISKERLGAVFDRFTQVDGSTTRKYGGTGLGLTISKQLVEAMGGQIGVSSEPGIGSTFWFTVVLDKQPEKALPRKTSLPVDLFRDVKDLRVLGIDDNQTNRKVLSKMIEGFGCRIDTASSGNSGVEMLYNAYQEGNPYHIVLLDMQMPGMDGEQTAQKIKNDPLIKNVQIIILTSMGQRGDAARLESMGCAAYLVKPVKQQMLFDTLRMVLARDDDHQPRLVTRHLISEEKRKDTHILLAEDNPINQKLAIILLQKAGFSVDAVENGRLAFEKLKNTFYNAVLMDVQMPDMDGFDATRRIREWEKTQGRHIPIIAMTAHALKGDRELCLEAGMDDYITKPLDPRALFAALDHWTLPQENSNNLSSVETNHEDYADIPANQSVMVDDSEEGLFGESSVEEPLKIESGPIVPDFPPEDESPMDVDGALPRFFNERSFFLEMVHDLVLSIPTRMQEIQTALDTNNVMDLYRHAHNLKGITSNFSAGPVSKLAAELEALGKSGDISDAPNLFEKLKIEIERLLKFCANELEVR